MRDPARTRAGPGAGATQPRGNPVSVGSRLGRWPALALATMLLGTASCGDSATEPAELPARVSVSPATTELAILGATVWLSAKVFDQNGSVMTGETVVWSSSDEAVATVTESGVVTAVGNGTATITATARTVSGSATVMVADPVAADRAVLVGLYEATDGPRWANRDGWLTDAPLGEWYGVSVDAAGRVLRISLGENELTGPIPPELGELSGLESLWLMGNRLTGAIPPELGDLSRLETLWLGGNRLTGAIPPELANLSHLESLWLPSNALTGAIPPEIGNLSRLAALHLHDNALTGAIPPELGNLTSLMALHLHENALTGGIPPELGNLTSLEVLILRDNALTGGIPPELGNLTSLIALTLQGNSLTDSIPPELGNLTSLEVLLLYDNALTGAIPPELGNLTRLRYLHLSRNELTGPIPDSFLGISGLREFYIAGNRSLCLPNTAAFRSWLWNIQYWGTAESVWCTGSYPSAPPTPPPSYPSAVSKAVTVRDSSLKWMPARWTVRPPRR